jgi:hypothetical protein
MLAALWQGELRAALGAVAEEVGFWSPRHPGQTGGDIIAQDAS